MGNAHYDAVNRNEKPVCLLPLRVVPVTGVSLVIPDGVHRYLVDPAGAIAVLNIKMPLKPYQDQEVSIPFSQAITTTFTLQPNTSQAFIGTPPTTITAGQVLNYQWSATDSKWWPK